MLANIGLPGIFLIAGGPSTVLGPFSSVFLGGPAATLIPFKVLLASI